MILMINKIRIKCIIYIYLLVKTMFVSMPILSDLNHTCVIVDLGYFTSKKFG